MAGAQQLEGAQLGSEPEPPSTETAPVADGREVDGEPPLSTETTAVAVGVSDEPTAQEGEDGLEAFALEAARRQAEARGDDDDGVEEGAQSGFIARALAESRRMRGEASLSHQKRAELAASIAARHGEQSRQVMADAMAEHAAEVLPDAESVEATGQGTATEEVPL